VTGLLPMEVASYLLNPQRKETAQREKEYKLALYLAGNTAARQNESSLEFIKSDIVPDIAPLSEKVVVKEIEEPVRPVTSVAAYRGALWEESEEIAITPPPPAVPEAVLVHGEQEQDSVNGETVAAI